MTDESADQFAGRARKWLADNMPVLAQARAGQPSRGSPEAWQRATELQRRLFEGGFAGICFPRTYGGLGLGVEYQRAFDVEAQAYEMPHILNIPHFTICCPTILDTATEDQKRTYLPAAIRGDDVLVQFLSEPSGGSDLAGVTTRADRRGDGWVINGAKTWSTGAVAADYGLLLARTNWEVPKHHGLTMFLVPIRSAGLTMRPITLVTGASEFCEEYFDDVEVGPDAVLGEVDDGWRIVRQMLFHERRAVGGGSEFGSGLAARSTNNFHFDYGALAAATRQTDGERVGQLAGRARVHRRVQEQLAEHVFHAVNDGSLPPAAGSIIRVAHAESIQLEVDTALAVAGSSAVVHDSAARTGIGDLYLARQMSSLGGGTVEVARNVIAERVLNLPREYAADRGVPFNQVKHTTVRDARGTPQ